MPEDVSRCGSTGEPVELSAVPRDTDPAAWRVAMAAIAALSPQGRLEELARLNMALAEMEFAALRRRYPSRTDQELIVLGARVRYGRELADAAWPEISARLDV